ncbi:C-X-C chemokine receptor type 5 [Rhinophrynus dorsalis]
MDVGKKAVPLRFKKEFKTNWNNNSFIPEDNDSSGFICPDHYEEDPWAKLLAFQRYFIPLVYSVVFVVGFLGNGLVLLILMRYRRIRSTTENILLHLTMADILMLTTFPFAVTESVAGWVFGDFLCKVVGVISRVNFFCSSLFLGCISVDRYLAIIHAIHAFRARRLVAVHLPCFGVWALCFLLSLPNLFILGIQKDGNLTTCTYNLNHFPSNGWWQTGRFLNHIVGFLLPLLIMSFCYAHIVAALCRSPRLEKKRAVKVAIVITTVFFLCWTPYNVAVFLDTLEQLGLVQSCMMREQLPIAVTVTEFLGYVHCCLNPILYAFVGVKFRNDVLRVLRKIDCMRSLFPEVPLTLDLKSNATDSDHGTMMSSL